MASKELNNAAAMGLSPSGGDCREIMIRTVYAEAFGEGNIGMEAVAWVIRNRAESGRFGGNSVGEVCLKNYQFEPWRSPSGLARIAGLETNSDNYNRVAAIVDRVLAADNQADITGGSTHFANAEIVRDRRNGAVTDWMEEFTREGKSFDLGRHTFYGGSRELANIALSQRGAENGFEITTDSGARFYARRDEQNNPSLLFLSEDRSAENREQENKKTNDFLGQMMSGLNGIAGSIGGFMIMLVAMAMGTRAPQESAAQTTVADNAIAPPSGTSNPSPSNPDRAKEQAQAVALNGCAISVGVCLPEAPPATPAVRTAPVSAIG